MKTAKELTQELLNESEDKASDANLKPEINELLWRNMPGGVTLKEADVLSMVILEIITNPEYFLGRNSHE